MCPESAMPSDVFPLPSLGFLIWHRLRGFTDSLNQREAKESPFESTGTFLKSEASHVAPLQQHPVGLPYERQAAGAFPFVPVPVFPWC